MNAYELADINDWSCCAHVKEVSTMLRQQADRIAELEKSHIELEKGIVADLNQRQSAEPVAWMLTLPDGTHDWILDGKGCEGYIPLYPTPQKYCPTENNAAYEKGVIDGMAKQRQSRVDGIIGQIGDSPIHDLVHRTTPQIKELSDAEIRTIQDMCHLKNVGYNTFIMRFARAILKKAAGKRTL